MERVFENTRLMSPTVDNDTSERERTIVNASEHKRTTFVRTQAPRNILNCRYSTAKYMHQMHQSCGTENERATSVRTEALQNLLTCRYSRTLFSCKRLAYCGGRYTNLTLVVPLSQMSVYHKAQENKDERNDDHFDVSGISSLDSEASASR